LARSFAAEDIPPSDVALGYASVLKARPAAVADRSWTTWGSGYGGYNKVSGDGSAGSADVTARAYGFAGGLDYRVTPDTVAGFALAGGGTDWALAQGLGSGRSDAFQAGAYGLTRAGPAYLAAALAFTNHWMSTERLAFAGDQATASFTAQSYGGRLEGGYPLGWAAPLMVTPYAAVQAQAFHTPRYSETDLAGFALSYAAHDATDTRSELGARFLNATTLGNGMGLTLRGRIAWAHDWMSDPALTAAFQSLPGASFIVNGATPAKNAALLSGGAELHVNAALSLTARFDSEVASRAQTYSGTAIVSYRW
jgi:outer membrane autotransporter protein